MNLEERIYTFVELGKRIKNLSNDEKKRHFLNAEMKNAWFTSENVERAFEGILILLDEENIRNWIKTYNLNVEHPKSVGIVMAGNIPLVGFHDFMSVLLSGHKALIKLSSSDNYLLPVLAGWLFEINLQFKKRIEFADRLNNADAFIATGTDNSARYFEYYFSKKPHIIRKNRTSVAVLKGNESETALANLSKDIFFYFGLGCRNVNYLLVPKGYDFNHFFKNVEAFSDVRNHHKYINNYDYCRSVLLVKNVPFLDNGFMILKGDNELFSPVSVLNFRTYSAQHDINQFLTTHQEKIQCVVGDDYVPFGEAQYPKIHDYADGIDTMKFLSELK